MSISRCPVGLVLILLAFVASGPLTQETAAQVVIQSVRSSAKVVVFDGSCLSPPLDSTERVRGLGGIASVSASKSYDGCLGLPGGAISCFASMQTLAESPGTYTVLGSLQFVAPDYLTFAPVEAVVECMILFQVGSSAELTYGGELNSFTLELGQQSGGTPIHVTSFPRYISPGHYYMKLRVSRGSLFSPHLLGDYLFSAPLTIEGDSNGPTSHGEGLTQEDPVFPAQGPAPTAGARFEATLSDRWFDPPLTNGFRFEMVSPDSSFTHIMGLPTGFGDGFELWLGGQFVGEFGDEDSVNLGELVGSDGVHSFEIHGIAPCVDAADPAAFPIQLAFSTPTATWDMIPMSLNADIDQNGSLNLDDIAAFAVAFLAQDPIADLDGSGSINVDDIQAFVACFLAGCP